MAFMQHIMDMFFGDMMDEYGSDDDDFMDSDSSDFDVIMDGGQLRRRGIGEDNAAAMEENLHPLVFSLNKLKNGKKQAKTQLSSLLDEASTSQLRSRTVPSLLDMAAKTVARTCSCEKLETHEPMLDESLLRKVAFWAFPQDEKQVQAFANVADQYNISSGVSPWKKGVDMYKSDRIKEMWQVGFMLTAYIYKYDNKETSANATLSQFEVRVSLTFEQQRIVSSSCSECKDDVWCPHVVAAILYRIKNHDQVRIHAPMTETLSTLTRDQLQKMLQYAIQEDPAGILGKVFKFLDDIRDNNSEMNMIPGAPDPTFGAASSLKTQWQLSVDRLEKNILHDLKEMSRYRSYDYYSSRSSYYPITYDLTEKVESRMFRYIQKALDLVQMKEMKSAICILNRITRHTLSVMASKSPGDSPSLSRYCHDLSRMYTLFMLYCGQYKYQTQLIKHLTEHQLKSSRLLVHKVTPSQWAELPSINDACHFRPKERLAKGLFTEALGAQTVGPWPKDLKRLLDGDVTVDESSYDEDIRLMLARLECLLFLEDTKIADIKVARLSAKILRKLAKQAVTDSILGVHFKQMLGKCPSKSGAADLLKKVLGPDTAFLDPVHSTPPPTPCSQPSTSTDNRGRQQTGKATAKGRRRSPRVANKRKRSQPPPEEESPSVPTKRSKKTETPKKTEMPKIPESLSKGQLTYAMLYCCQNIIMCEKSVGRDLENRELLAVFCLLALELSRHRIASEEDSLSSAEHNWLLFLEQSLCQHITASAKSAAVAINLYVDAFRTHGAKFYQGAYPLILTDCILFLACKEDEMFKSRKNDLLHLCADFILDNPNPLEKFKLRYSSSLDDIISYKKHREFAFNKFHTFIDTYFSLLNPDNKPHIELTVKVLRHFENYDESKLLNAVNRDLRFHSGKFRENKDILEACLSVAVNAMKTYDDMFRTDPELHSQEMTRTYITGLVAKLGASSLSTLLGKWQGLFKCADIKKLLSGLRIENQPADLPKEAQQLLREYFEMERMHSDMACEMLDYFEPSNKNYRDAVDIICQNAHWYTVDTLFEISKREHAFFSSKRKKGKGGATVEYMTPEVFRFIEKAVVNLGLASIKNLSNLTSEYLSWACQVCAKKQAGGKDRPKEGYFSRLVSVIQKHVWNKPDILIDVLQFAEKNKEVHSQAKPLCDSLINSYNSFFVDRVNGSGHTHYGAVINEMHRARYHCIDHVPNGGPRFDKEVIAVVKRFHSGKKKLVRMLDEEFATEA